MAGTRNASGETGGESKVVQLGSQEQSSNARLGIDSRVEDGTTGSRPDSSSIYGGERDQGDLFKVQSASSPDEKGRNAGGNERDSASAGFYGSGAGAFETGGVAARQGMTIGGDQGPKTGKYVGEGAKNSGTPLTSATDQLLGNVKTAYGNDVVVGGTADARKNMDRAQRGISRGGGKSKN